jgi:peptide-methionine (R)-S-oxide reductase
MMLKWPAVLNPAKKGHPAPDCRIEKTPSAWRQLLSPEDFQVTRHAGTGGAFSSPMYSLFEPGIYDCCGGETILFDAMNAIAYFFDGPSFLNRVEAICNTRDAQPGHVFPDGPTPSGLRYCMSAVALRKIAGAITEPAPV